LRGGFDAAFLVVCLRDPPPRVLAVVALFFRAAFFRTPREGCAPEEGAGSAGGFRVDVRFA